MMKIKLKSRNFEKLQRLSAFSTKSAKIATKFENIANFLAFLILKTPKN